MASVFHLYCVTNLENKKQYIGQVAGRRVSSRWASHLSTARNGRGYELHDAIRLTGEDSFVCEHIASALSNEDLDPLEQLFIEDRGTLYPYGYNRTKGGKGGDKVGEAIYFEGRSWISLPELCRHHSVTYDAVYQRLNYRDWTLRQALELDPPPKKLPNYRNPTTVMVDGERVEFESFAAACRHFVINDGHARDRMTKYGWSLEEALGVIPRKRAVVNRKPLFVSDEYFPSVKAACEAFGIRQDKFYDRKRRGWTTEQCLGFHQPPPKHHPLWKPLKIGTYSFSSSEAATRFFGLYEHAISTRLRAGWSPEQAAGLEPPPDNRSGKHPNSQAFTVEGVDYPSISKIAEAYGIHNPTISKRLRRGLTIEEAVKLGRGHADAKKVIVEGVEYPSLAAIGRHYGIPAPTLTKRLQKGMSVEEAVGLSKPPEGGD
jgi:hypothetical protein